ncbi:MAG TPA: alpha/beta hydrolase [Vicinamibacterales bacterium]|nr:alpha/beta hydrolase [Acidobacteriota bacterium]HOC17479.1 alpha/beta hydrolase [Vicinamibacterales bacterium]
MNAADPHGSQPVLRRGPDPAAARLCAILLHGRGSTASDILSLADELDLADVLYLAPDAAGHTWYPYSFLQPLDRNQPHLDSALALVDRAVARLGAAGVPPARVALLGFSQGACLALEYAARHARRYAAVVGLSGGVIGPPGTPRAYEGSMEATPVFLGCSNVDPHIPVERVHETAGVFRTLGALVDERIYPGMGHVVNDEEIQAVRELLLG